VALNLWRGPNMNYRARMCPEPKPFVPFTDSSASLRPSTASLMAYLARIKPGDVVIDPMCGLGTVPLVACVYTACGLALGGDVDEHTLHQAHRNAGALRRANDDARMHHHQDLSFARWVDGPPHMAAWHETERRVARRPDGGGGGAQALLWSAAKLPLRPGCVDCAIVDLPFGMVHKLKGGKSAMRALYSKVRG
jgi:tRNA G10  N-methylase Trm11